MTQSVPSGELRRLGDRAFLIGVASPAAGRSLARVLRQELAGNAEVDVVCGFATVAVLLVDHDTDLEPVLSRAGRVAAAFVGSEADAGTPPGRLVRVPCVFDGPDLAEVAARSGCDQDEVVGYLTERPLTVAVLGFSPGFAYLDGLPEPLRAVPRRDHPRPVVPAGSVALANGHAAVYPTASPGGWHLVGRTGLRLFSPEAPPYALLAPGDRVRLTLAGAGDPVDPAPLSMPAWSPPATARLVLQVVSPGMRAVVQDGGRRGVASAGVPGAGPADPVSFTLANRLVGNPDSSGTIEVTGGGTRLRGVGPSHLAVVGAAPRVRLDGAEVPAGQVVPLAAGHVFEVGPLQQGCRTYVSVAGGFAGPSVFGSSASDELCGLGAGPLVAGQSLYAGPWAPPLGDHVAAGAASAAAAGAPLDLRVVPGPHPELFEPGALERLGDVVFVVERDSNRVGIRLREEDGPTTLRRPAADSELDSQGVVTGAVQVPTGGDPVILMPDHATLGGYPVLAVVASADHGLLGQCAPGTRVRLVPIGQDDARAARHARRRALDGAVIGHYPLSAG
jgi:KipI family sensor histidine kinase inhibitor